MTTKKVTEKKAVPKKPAAGFVRTNIYWHYDGYSGCCGSQIIFGFSSNLYNYRGRVEEFPDLDNIPSTVLDELRRSLSAYPQTTAITQINARTGGQYVANKVLPQIGFEEVKRFKGNGGTHLALWVYVRPGKRIKASAEA